MKKITLMMMAVVYGLTGFSQVNSMVEAPQDNGSTTQVRAPNGLSNYAYQRGCFLVTQADLGNIPIGTNISSFGFTLSTGAAATVAGNFTLYVENTADATYLKGTSYPTAISTMTNVFANVMTIPASVGTNSIYFTLSSPFVYTGGALYVAFDWFSPGPYSSTPATYLADNGALLNPGGATAFTGIAPAPVTLATTAFRPAFLFGFSNPYNNDIEVVGIETPGKVAFSLNTPHNIVGVIRNASNITKTNVTVSLTVAGVNPVSATQVIASMAPGAVQSVTFGPYNPQLSGANSISVSVAPDQNNSNNLSTYSQSITCSTWAQNPATGSYTSGVGFTAPAIFTSKYRNVSTSTLTGLNFGLSTDPLNVNNPGYAVLLDANGVILATSNTLIITSPMLGTTLSFNFSPQLVLSANTTYYLGVAQPVIGYSPAGGYVVPYVISNTYYFCNLAGGAFTPLPSNLGYFRLEGVFNPSINITASAPIVCSGSPITLTATGPTSYTWNQGTTVLSANQNLTVSPLIGTVYSLVGTNTLGCNYNASFSVSVNPLPNLSVISSTNAICIGSSLSFSASGATSYSVNNLTSVPNVTVSPTANISYLVSGSNANGCVATTTLDVTVNSLTLTVSSNTAICLGKTVILSASSSGNYSYNWNLGLVNIPFGVTSPISPTQTATYSVTAVDNNNGCSKTNTVMVTVNANPTVMIASSSPTVCKGRSVTLTASGASTYSWNTTATGASFSVSPATTTNYIATGTNTDGCTGTTSFQQLVFICTSLNEVGKNNTVFQIFPNPNNGHFTIAIDQFESVKSVEIYNMLGALIQHFDINSTTNTVDMSQQSNGLYMVKVLENNKLLQISKIVKQ